MVEVHVSGPGYLYRTDDGFLMETFTVSKRASVEKQTERFLAGTEAIPEIAEVKGQAATEKHWTTEGKWTSQKWTADGREGCFAAAACILLPCCKCGLHPLCKLGQCCKCGQCWKCGECGQCCTFACCKQNCPPACCRDCLQCPPKCCECKCCKLCCPWCGCPPQCTWKTCCPPCLGGIACAAFWNWKAEGVFSQYMPGMSGTTTIPGKEGVAGRKGVPAVADKLEITIQKVYVIDPVPCWRLTLISKEPLHSHPTGRLAINHQDLQAENEQTPWVYVIDLSLENEASKIYSLMGSLRAVPTRQPLLVAGLPEAGSTSFECDFSFKSIFCILLPHPKSTCFD